MIVEVVSRAHESIVGRYFEEGGIGFVVPDNPKVQQEVLITPGRNGAAKVGQFVEVKITHWPTARFQPQGDIVEVVGNYMAPGMEIDVALRTYDIPHVWPEAVLKEAAKLKPEVEEKDKEKRIDLRHLPRRCPRLRRCGLLRSQAWQAAPVLRRLEVVRRDCRRVQLREDRFGPG